MNRIISKGVPILALSFVLAACGQDTAEAPSASPKPSPSERPAPAEPSERPSEPMNQPSQEPSDVPAEQPSQQPSAPPVAPEPIVVEHPVPMVARVTADGVAVRNLPDLESGIVNGNDAGDVIVDSIRLSAGDEVVVLLGPVYADGISWYEVMAGGIGPAAYFRGWIAGAFLEQIDDAPMISPILSLDGQGFSASASGNVGDYSALKVSHAATPMPGDDACTFEMTMVGTAGQTILLVPEQVVTDARVGQIHAGELESLYMGTGGTISLDVASTCSFAAAVNMPQG